MATTRKQLITSAARRLGGRTGTVLSGSGTTLVLGGLIGTTGDNNAYKQDLLFLLDADIETDKERMITEWVDATGTATVPVRTESNPAGESYVLVNRQDYTLAEYRTALNEALTRTPRSYRYVLGLTPGITMYPLNNLTWLEGAKDVDAATYSSSPCVIHNEDFGLWQEYTSPDGWTLSGTASRVTGFGEGGYAVQLEGTLQQSMPPSLVQWLARINTANVTVYAAAWVTCPSGSVARVGVSDGTTTTWSEYHTGSGVPEYLHATHDPVSSDKDYAIVLEADGATAVFNRSALYPGTALDLTLKDYGSQGYPQSPIQPQQIRNVGGIPVVELGFSPSYSPGYGRLIITSRRPFSPMTSDDDAIDDQYAKALESGLLRWLLEPEKPGQDRTRLDRVLVSEAQAWTDRAQGFVDRPVGNVPNRTEVWGA